MRRNNTQKDRPILRTLTCALIVSLASSGFHPQALAQSRLREDDMNVRRCTANEEQFIKNLLDPTSDQNIAAQDSAGGAPAGNADGGGDWLTPGTDAYKVAQEIYDFWTKKIGTSGAFAAGVLSNVKQESNFIPNVSEGFGRFEIDSKTPDSGGPGGGLYQFTPYSKYTDSPQWGGWRVDPQSMFVWEAEFINGSVEAGMKNAPNLYGIEAPFDRAYTAIPTDNGAKSKVVLDPNALVTTNDPEKASKGFQVGYERPGAYHPEREPDAVAANKVFNKDNYKGDAAKLEAALPSTAGVNTAINAIDTIASYASGAMSPLEKASKDPTLFKSPCILKNGVLILDLRRAIEYARSMCARNSTAANSASGSSSTRGSSGDPNSKIMNADKLQPNARKLAEDAAKKFPELETIGGWRASDPYPDHPSGRAVDIMIPDYSSSKGKALGDKIEKWVHDNKKKYNVDYTIWRQQYHPVNGPGNTMEDRGGDTANHFDHVHVTTNNGAWSGGNSDSSGGSSSSSSQSSPLGEKVLVIGDSLSVGAESKIKDKMEGVTVNASVGRQFSEGLSILESESKKDWEVIVMALGTNGPYSQADLDQALKAAGDAKVVLMTVGGKNVSSADAVNSLVEKNSSKVTVMDWGEVVEKDPSLIGGDGVHPTDAGQEAFATEMTEAVSSLKGEGSSSNSDNELNCGPTSGGSGSSVAPNAKGIVIPTTGTYTSPRGMRDGAMHDGIDIANDEGTPIYAVRDGKVIDSGPAQGYGNWIRIKHEDGSITEYGHQRKNLVKVGDTVKAGDHIAEMGSLGFSTGPHLHLRTYGTDGTTTYDPVELFEKNGIDWPELGGHVEAGSGKGKSKD